MSIVFENISVLHTNTLLTLLGITLLTNTETWYTKIPRKDGGGMTAVSKSKRTANDKWDKENMLTIGCKISRADAESFKAYAADRGVTANTLLKEYVYQCIKKEKESR